jgi:hypothetical protein
MVGSALDRHIGYLYDNVLRVSGESLHRLAVATAPVPIGCHGWVSLSRIERLDVLSGGSVVPPARRRPGDQLWVWNSWDIDWAVDRNAPFSRAELLNIGYGSTTSTWTCRYPGYSRPWSTPTSPHGRSNSAVAGHGR